MVNFKYFKGHNWDVFNQIGTKKNTGAQQRILTNIPMKFHDYKWNTSGAMYDTSEKWSISGISRAITMAFLIKWK